MSIENEPEEKMIKKRKSKKSEIQNTVEVEIIDENYSSDSSNMSVKELLAEYNTIQEEVYSKSFISSDFTIKGMDDINQLISDAVLQIDEFTNNGKADSFFGRITNKAVKIFDPKDAWLGKWANKARENALNADLQNKTPDEIVNLIKSAIELKLKDIEGLVKKLYQEKEINNDRISYYRNILKKAQNIFNNSAEDTEENFSAQMLITRIQGSIIELESTINMDINPLITSSKIAAEKIAAELPTLSTKLKGKLNIKAIQQQLSDVTSVTQIAADLYQVVDEKVTQSVQETTLQTLDMLSNSGVNVAVLKQKMKRDDEFKQKLLNKVDTIKREVNKEFNEIQNISATMLEHNKTKTELFLESYSSSDLTK